MVRRFLVVLVSFAFVGLAAVAHGDLKHVIGTVEKMTADSITVKTKTGSLVEVKLAAATMFVKNSGGVKTPAKIADVAVGDRVVIHAKPKGDLLEAAEVEFAAAGAATANKPKP